MFSSQKFLLVKLNKDLSTLCLVLYHLYTVHFFYLFIELF